MNMIFKMIFNCLHGSVSTLGIRKQEIVGSKNIFKKRNVHYIYKQLPQKKYLDTSYIKGDA